MQLRTVLTTRLAAVAAASVLAFGAAQPALAQRIVFDPSNYVQNTLTAIRTLEQINNQIKQLQNDARNLASLPFNAVGRLRANLATTQRLIAQAKGLAYELATMDRDFARLYPEQYAATVSGDQMYRDAQERWKNTLQGLQTTLRMQAQASQNLGEDEGVLADLVRQSQSAVGALQAMQATNQLLALQAKQSIQVQRLQITQDRAASLELARRTSSVFFRSANQRASAVPAGQGAAAPSALAAGLAGFDPLAAGPASTAAQPSDPTVVQNRQDQKEGFQKAGTTETRNSGILQLPASPYQVMAGTVIAAALVTGIKSDLPGDVIATVTEPVYDTATGKFLLIPQGSRILGKYNSQVSYGQSRVQMVWNRVILPDTSSLTLDNLVGTDPAGCAGLEDGVDRHWGRILAGAALTTLLGVGAELAAPENRQDGNRVVIAGRDSVQDSVNQIGQEMTRRNMNIQPTLTARPGLPVRVIVNRDLVLRPYQPLFFNKGAMR
ncbi:MAG: P-type conjugative transfer protein TrbJ [Burkholderiales bacterium]|nr:P-type conjugative transfer protein TrbJ [Burkholderiales bacterium]